MSEKSISAPWGEPLDDDFPETPAPLGMDTPWPLHDVLAKLIQATEHLRTAHNCDAHGHEEYWTAEHYARIYMAEIARKAMGLPEKVNDPTWTRVFCPNCHKEQQKGAPPDEGQFYMAQCSFCPAKFLFDYAGQVRRLGKQTIEFK